MRAAEVGPLEMRVAEVGPLEMRAAEVGPFQNRAAKIETPIVGALAFPALLTSPLDHRQNGGDIGCRFSEFFLLSGSRPKVFSPPVWPASLQPQEIGAPRYPLLEVLRGALGFVPPRAFPDEGGQVLHHRPVIVRAFLRNPLQRVDAAQAHLELVASKLLHGFGEAFRDASLTIGVGLREVADQSDGRH